MSLIRDTADYYVGRLASVYANGARARNNIGIYVKQALGDMMFSQIGDAFNIDTAVGTQLDVLGKYIGLPRTIGDPIAQPFYQFSDSDGTVRANGFRDSTNPATNAAAIWYDSNFLGNENTALSDVAYLFMLKLKIVLNRNDGTLASIMALLQEFFPTTIGLTDNQDMTLTYTLGTEVPVSPTVIQKYLPKPMGVGINFIYLTGTSAPNPLTTTLIVPHGDHGLHTVVSADVTVTPMNGVAPFFYAWEYVSGSTIIQLGAPVGGPVQRWFAQGINPFDQTSIWRCAISDARGIVGYTPNQSIRLKIQEAP